MRGFDGTTKGLDPLPLGLRLSCLIWISKDTMVDSLTELTSNKPHLLEDIHSQKILHSLNNPCHSPKRVDRGIFKEIVFP